MRRPLCVIVFTTLTLAGSLIVPNPAAALPLLLCSGSYETTLDPGLTFDPQDVEIVTSTTYDHCFLHLTVASGVAQAGPFTQPDASCLDLTQGITTGQSTITWNTTETTTYTWQATAAQVGSSVVVTAVGTVTAGKFLGAHVVRQTAGLNAEIESGCLSEGGLETDTGPATLVITWP